MKTCALFLLLFIPQHPMAENWPPLSTDSRVRITAPTVFSNPVTGQVMRVHSDTLLLTPHIRVPFQGISKLELSLGVQPIGARAQTHAWKGAVLIGGLVSAALIDSWDDWDDRSGNKALLAICGGGVVGGTLGGIFGAFHRPERWTGLPPALLERYAPSNYRAP